MSWNYMIIKEKNQYYLGEVFYKKLKKRKIKHNKYMYAIIFEGNNREDILKKIKRKEIDYKYWKLDDENYLFMKKDLLFFRKTLKVKV